MGVDSMNVPLEGSQMVLDWGVLEMGSQVGMGLHAMGVRSLVLGGATGHSRSHVGGISATGAPGCPELCKSGFTAGAQAGGVWEFLSPILLLSENPVLGYRQAPCEAPKWAT